MRWRINAKAYEVSIGRFRTFVTRETYLRLDKDPERKYALRKAEVTRVVGNRKYEIDTKAVSKLREILKEKNPPLRKKEEARDRRIAESDRKWRERYKVEQARKAAKAAKELAAFVESNPLPKGLTVGDLVQPSCTNAASSLALSRALYGSDYGGTSFEILYTERFGWVAAVLLIRRATWRNKGGSNRTYAVSLKNGEMCRVGFGPHILRKETVYVTKSNVERLEAGPIPIVLKGSIEANDCRDRISTRRAFRRRYYY